MVYNRSIKKSISIICFLLCLSFSVLLLVGCDVKPRDKVLNLLLNRELIVVNGYEYELVANDNWVHNEGKGFSFYLKNNGTWSWEYSRDNMDVIGQIHVTGAYIIFSNDFDLYASNEDPPIFLYIHGGVEDGCYMLKGYTLPSKYTASFSSIDFASNSEDICFDTVVSMEDIISYENAILDENCEMKHFCSAKLFYSGHNVLYLNVDIFVINEKFYILLDDVYYPIVMIEILNSLIK